MEENKVAQKLAERINCCAAVNGDAVAKFILQSPELRVTLVEPRCHVEAHGDGFGTTLHHVKDKHGNRHALFINKEHAEEYCAKLNSKEPK